MQPGEQDPTNVGPTAGGADHALASPPTPHPNHLGDAAGDEINLLARRCVETCGRDRDAFEALHDRLTPGLRAFFARRVPGGAANVAIDDLMQRVWTGLWEAFAAGRYDPARSAVSTFVYAIATKTWLRHLRSERGRKRQSDRGGSDQGIEALAEQAEALTLSDDPFSEAAAAELLEAVRTCLRTGGGEGGAGGGLSEQERAIVVAAAAGASDRALAQRMGLAASSVNAKKQSGLEKIRRYLARLGHRTESGERGGPGGQQLGTG